MDEKLEKYLVSAVITGIGGVLTYFGAKRDDKKGDIMFKSGMGFIGIGTFTALKTAGIEIPKIGGGSDGGKELISSNIGGVR